MGLGFASALATLSFCAPQSESCSIGMCGSHSERHTWKRRSLSMATYLRTMLRPGGPMIIHKVLSTTLSSEICQGVG